MIAERKYDNGERKRKEGERKEKEARRRQRLPKRFGYCVKCNATFQVTATLLPPAPDASPRWSKFAELVTCPNCGDDKGHAGIFAAREVDITIERLEEHERKREKPNPIALRAADLTVKEILDALSERPIEETERALIEHRSISEDFAKWLTEKGVRFGTVEELRFKVSATTFSKLKMPKGFDLKAGVFFLPIKYHFDPSKPYFVGLQIRQTAKDAEPRYITERLGAPTPLVHFALPTINGTLPNRVDEVWLTEGYFKAEAIAFYRKAVAIGALGTIAQWDAVEALTDAALWWQKDADLFTATVILAPDADYRQKKEVATAAWKAKNVLQRKGFKVKFAIWERDFKGIDDALTAGIEPAIVDEDVWLATLPRTIRDALLRARTKTRVLLDREIAEAIELPESEPIATAVEAEKYEAERRKEYWLEAIAKEADRETGRCKTVIVDTSATGTGKTKAAASLRLTELRKAGIWAKRLIYIAPEVKRPAVAELERFRLFEGRDAECVYYDRLQVLEQEGLTHIGRKVCAHCPMRKLCGYYAQRQTARRYWRFSWQSYSPREGDFVVLDEFSRLPIYRHFVIGKREFGELLRSVDQFGADPELMRTLKELRKWLDEREKTNEEVKELFTNVTTSAWDWFAHYINTLHSDIRATREWVYKKRDERPKGFWWAEWLADIMRGKKVGQVWVEEGKLRIMSVDPKLKSLAEKASAILILDATVDPTQVWELFGTSVYTVRSDEREDYPTVIQVPIFAMSHRAKTQRKEEALRLAKTVVDALTASGRLPVRANLGVITHKDAAERAKKVFGRKAVIGWWGRDERATNIYYEAGVTVLVAVGLPHRNIGAIAAERMKAGYKLKALRKVRLDREGNWWTIIREFADRDLAAEVRKEVANSYKQAAGRLRQNKRTEQCYMVVLDIEPLPPELNPIIVLPEEVLPEELLRQWKAKQQRGLATVNALKRKAHAEKLLKVAALVMQYKWLTGEKPPKNWVAEAARCPERTAARLIKEAEEIMRVGIDAPEEWRTAWTLMCDKLCHTFALNLATPLHLHTYPECVARFVTPHLPAAVAFFVTYGYPIPYRALARRFGIHPQQVKRLATRMKAHMEEHGIKPKPIDEAFREVAMAAKVNLTPPESPPPCPECGTELEPDEQGFAVCVGCGREWKWLEGSWVRVWRPESELSGDFG